jgi:iron complex outermembrane receptor protein
MKLNKIAYACLLSPMFFNSSLALSQEQEQEAPTPDGKLEVIEVTSQHRVQSIQDVPLTVSAISGAELEKADINDASEIALSVPGFAYSEFAPGQAILSMRGINSADDGAGIDNSVGLFLDGVYIGRGAAINFDMFDLERIEVLKGPQGTLFGRNSIGGVISVITKKPTDDVTAKVSATVGNEGIVRYAGYVSGPLTEKLSGKLSYTHREHDGFVDNVVLGTELNDEDTTSVRGQLVYYTDNGDWTLSADYMEDDRADMGRVPIANNAPVIDIAAANGGNRPHKSASPYDGFAKREASGISLTGDFRFDSGNFTTITASRSATSDWEMASVGAGLGALGLPFDEVNDDIYEEIDSFSQEFRWVSNVGDKFNYTLGAFYFTEDTSRSEEFKITQAGTYDGFKIIDVGTQATIGNEYTLSDNATTSYAFYGQGNYEINDSTTLTLGARYTKDKKDYLATAVDCGGDRTGTEFEDFFACAGGIGGSLNIVAESFTVTPEETWSDFSPMASLQYKIDDNKMVFATVSRGFKSGGFGGSQGIATAAETPVNPETATNFELGFKGDLLDDTLRFNTTIFKTDYEDLQVVRFGPVVGSEFGAFVTANIGTADIKGLEMDFQWLATDNLSFSGNYAYLDTKVNGLVIETNNGLQDASGKPLTAAPENSYSLVANYAYATDIGEFDVRIQYAHVDEQSRDYLDDRVIIEEHDLIDLRVGWVSQDEDLEVALWVKNLAGEDYIAHSYVIGPGVIGVWGPPRTVGVTATYRVW